MLKAKLVVVGGDAKSAEVNLKRLPCIIGRGKEATLTLPHPLVSRRHTELFEKDGRLWVRDLGSLNGTFLNNKRLESAQPIDPNQLLTLGNVTFRAVYEPLDDQETDPTPVAVETIRDSQENRPTQETERRGSDLTETRPGPTAERKADVKADPVALNEIAPNEIAPNEIAPKDSAPNDDAVTDDAITDHVIEIANNVPAQSGLSGLSALDSSLSSLSSLDQVVASSDPLPHSSKSPRQNTPQPESPQPESPQPESPKSESPQRATPKAATADSDANNTIDLDSDAEKSSSTSDTNKSMIKKGANVTSDVFVELEDNSAADKSISLSSLESLPPTQAAMSFMGVPPFEEAKPAADRVIEAVDIDLGDGSRKKGEDDKGIDSFIRKLPR